MGANMKAGMALRGFRELDQQLATLPRKLRGKALRNAGNAGARVIRDEARRRSGSARIAKAIVVRSVRRGVRRGIAVSIGVVQRLSWLGHIVEFGAKPHTIKAGIFKTRAARTNKSKVLANPRTGEVFGQTVQHPGAPARPFLEPALASKSDEAIEAVKRRLWAEIQKAIKS